MEKSVKIFSVILIIGGTIIVSPSILNINQDSELSEQQELLPLTNKQDNS